MPYVESLCLFNLEATQLGGARQHIFHKLLQLGKHLALQRVALRLQILKGGTDKDPECARCNRHAYAAFG